MTTTSGDPPAVKDESPDRIDAIHHWLERFAAAVRAADYDAGRALFHPDAVGFGTFTRMAIGRENLIESQWRNIWGCTRGFRFLLDEAVIQIEGDIAWVATPWHSQGRDEAGQWFDRHGRTTLILRRQGDRWLCVHSHYSRVPTPVLNGNATPA